MTTSQSEQDIWDAYHRLLLGHDIERLRKLLARYDFFRRSLRVPGDIVECGVFKGAGVLTWLKFLQIHAPGSAKRVVGFDMFTGFPESPNATENEQIRSYVANSSFDGGSVEQILDLVAAAGIARERCELVAGDIVQTAPAYVERYPGFRISLLHLDLDLADATRSALEAFWPRVVRGGVVVFDEYAFPTWTESGAVDDFFSNDAVRIATLPWSRTPTAYVIKGSEGRARERNRAS